MKKIVLPAIAALSFAAGTLAFAQAQPQPAPNERAARQEQPKRTHVSREQFGERRLGALKSADMNGDGKLSHEELEKFALKQQAKRAADRMTRRLDIDGDGIVTLAEIERHQQKRFALFDRNDDGKLERREWREMRRKVPHHGDAHRWHHGPESHQGKPHDWPRQSRPMQDEGKMEL
ncbi:hypothetical protein [Limoniibacter endophyticus]|uniref:EF-hand domain-containing protein n=1 Tax=Limoniibacter endophyticus TaxID=1565040 RepID=A0A8J3GGM1_9HYPH|nr:hypothetical protein [Limoniibacter endophyticus]GHC65751.1 hypothetical protein GCM10010136_08710 [Limoniibacter endophyticus]